MRVSNILRQYLEVLLWAMQWAWKRRCAENADEKWCTACMNVYHDGFDKARIICYNNGALRSHPRITVFLFCCHFVFVVLSSFDWRPLSHNFFHCNKSRVHLLIFLITFSFITLGWRGLEKDPVFSCRMVWEGCPIGKTQQTAAWAIFFRQTWNGQLTYRKLSAIISAYCGRS